MNWLDIVIIVLLAITTLIGLWVGIIKAVLSLAGLIVGVVLASRFYVPLSERLTFIPQAAVAKIVAFALILIAVMVIAFVLARLLSWIISMMMLGWVNHLGGAVVGCLLGILICAVLLAIWIEFFGIGGPITDSVVARILLRYFPLAHSLLPHGFDTT